MSNVTWTPVAADSMPPNGAAVEVITEGGDQRPLIYDEGLWWLPDKAMYCYFVPAFWRLA